MMPVKLLIYLCFAGLIVALIMNVSCLHSCALSYLYPDIFLFQTKATQHPSVGPPKAYLLVLA